MNEENIKKQEIEIDKILNKLKKINIINYVLFGLSIICIPLGIIFLVIAVKSLDGFLLYFFSIFIEVMGIVFFAIFYFDYVNHNKNIDFNDLKQEFLNGYVDYSNPISMYFTKNLFISYYFYLNVVKFKDIIWMYNNYNFIIIALKNGKKFYLPNPHAAYQGEDIYINFTNDLYNNLSKINPQILFGNTLENKKEYKRIINTKNYYDDLN